MHVTRYNFRKLLILKFWEKLKTIDFGGFWVKKNDLTHFGHNKISHKNPKQSL